MPDYSLAVWIGIVLGVVLSLADALYGTRAHWWSARFGRFTYYWDNTRRRRHGREE